MRTMGFEPTRVFTHYPLKIARLPFRHVRMTIEFIIRYYKPICQTALIQISIL